MVDVGGNVAVACAGAQTRLRLLQLGAGIIHQDNLFIARVAGRVAPGACAQFQQQPALGGHQPADGNGFSSIFISPVALFPEGSLVIRAFVITDWRGIWHVIPRMQYKVHPGRVPGGTRKGPLTAASSRT